MLCTGRRSYSVQSAKTLNSHCLLFEEDEFYQDNKKKSFNNPIPEMLMYAVVKQKSQCPVG